MERLIVKYYESDGCSYSSENTVPVTFASKEEFLIVFEEKLQAYQKLEVEFMEKYQTLLNLQHEAMRTLEKSRSGKKNSPINEQLSQAWMKARAVATEFYTKQKPAHEFNMGYQKFDCENFFHTKHNKDNSRVKTIVMPEVFTVDEFFEQVEY